MLFRRIIAIIATQIVVGQRMYDGVTYARFIRRHIVSMRLYRWNVQLGRLLKAIIIQYC